VNVGGNALGRPAKLGSQLIIGTKRQNRK